MLKNNRQLPGEGSGSLCRSFTCAEDQQLAAVTRGRAHAASGPAPYLGSWWVLDFLDLECLGLLLLEIAGLSHGDLQMTTSSLSLANQRRV